jgi:hypothetical protein
LHLVAENDFWQYDHVEQMFPGVALEKSVEVRKNTMKDNWCAWMALNK